MKIGQSQDLHQLVEGRELVLGGVKIPFDKGTLGHSDGDALVHAITEAIIGALGMGDLGKFFPDNDPKYQGIDSLLLLGEANKMMKDMGYYINNIDSLIIIQKPKMAPYIDEMRSRISETLMIDKSLVNVKATTNEGLDAVGKGDAVIAQAIVLLNKEGE